MALCDLSSPITGGSMDLRINFHTTRKFELDVSHPGQECDLSGPMTGDSMNLE
jgi:hypothetical protein